MLFSCDSVLKILPDKLTENLKRNIYPRWIKVAMLGVRE
jgi:hypothetical protein